MNDRSLRMLRLAFLASFLVFASSARVLGQDEEIRFARYPHAGNGMLAFAYHGDIWVARDDGSEPRRLTAHVANDRLPRFSPDGGLIAFTSDRMGNDDVFVMPVSGGEPRQLTFHSGNDTALYWTPDGKRVLLATNRGAGAWGSPIHHVGLDGDLPLPLPMDRAAAGMLSQDGKHVAFNRLGFRYWRKGYRGNNNTDIWVQDLASKEIRQLTDLDTKQFREHSQDAFPMWGADGMLYFMSERDGIFNIWKISPEGGEASQVTRHQNDGVQYPSISADGRTITYENEFRLWKLSVPDGSPEAVSIRMAFDPKINLVGYERAKDEADGFSPSPSGDYVAVDSRGEIFIVPTDPEIGEKKQVTNSGWRERYQSWSPDGKSLAYISDESGDEEVWVHDLESGSRRRMTEHESLKRRPIWSPDSKQLAHVAANRLFIIDVAEGTGRELAYNSEGGYSLEGFSPDGKGLIYSRRDVNLNSEVYYFDLASGQEANLTQNPFRDQGGELSKDGKTLFFISDRAGDSSQLFKVSLARQSEDPNDPLVRERKKQAKGKKKDGEKEEEPEESDTAAVQIDLEGIDKRAVQLTRGGERVSGFRLSKDGSKVYFLSRDDKGSGLFSISVDGKDRKKIADGSFSGMTLTADGKQVFYRQGNQINRVPLGSKKKEKIAFEFTVTIDRRDQWRQILDESWRIMKYRFYDENMHGVDWEATK
ncbi:MAG: S41 family peptidase, partial [Planctomycetota bacterium]